MFLFDDVAVNYVMHSCSPARTTPGVSLCRGLTPEENIGVVITQGRVIDDNLKSPIKNQLCVVADYSC